MDIFFFKAAARHECGLKCYDNIFIEVNCVEDDRLDGSRASLLMPALGDFSLSFRKRRIIQSRSTQ